MCFSMETWKRAFRLISNTGVCEHGASGRGEEGRGEGREGKRGGGLRGHAGASREDFLWHPLGRTLRCRNANFMFLRKVGAI